MKALLLRFKAPLNKFWLRIRFIAVLIVSSSTSIVLAKNELGLDLPAWLATFCTYAIVAGAVLGLSAQMTKK